LRRVPQEAGGRGRVAGRARARPGRAGGRGGRLPVTRGPRPRWQSGRPGNAAAPTTSLPVPGPCSCSGAAPSVGRADVLVRVALGLIALLVPAKDVALELVDRRLVDLVPHEQAAAAARDGAEGAEGEAAEDADERDPVVRHGVARLDLLVGVPGDDRAVAG